MIRTITTKKPVEELKGLWKDYDRIFIIGCGTCTTMCRTGGQQEVKEMADLLTKSGKLVTGSMVVPVACDELTRDIVIDNGEAINSAQVLVIMTCAFGVQTISKSINKPLIPALDTVFIGKETGPGTFEEICNQCGQCVLGMTAGICPITYCHKGLLNGPCGGTNKGKCEIDPQKDCAWTLIYNRLKEMDKLDLMYKFQPPRDFNIAPKPAKMFIPYEEERSEEYAAELP